MWVFFVIAATLLQTIRNGFKSELSTSVSAVGVTFARYIWSIPIVALSILLICLFVEEGPYLPNLEMIPYAILTGFFQIIATVAMVQLFQMENYAVGAGLAKSEAIAAAILGVLFFGSNLNAVGMAGVALGFIAVLIMSIQGVSSLPSVKTLALGVFCGVGYAISSLLMREAALRSGLMFPLDATWVLFIALVFQFLGMAIYIRFKEPDTFRRLRARAKTTTYVSLTSTFGSLAWFSAMALMDVAITKTVGQIEVLFTLIYAHYVLKQKPTQRDIWGLILIGIAAVMVMLPA